MEVLIMKTYLRHVLPITLALLAACSENKLDVGNVDQDAGGPDSAGGGSQGCKEGEVRVEGCRECVCDVKTGQFQCPTLLCMPDGGTSDSGADGPILCEYQGRMVGVDEVFPAKDNCNTCSCNPATRQMMCTLKLCYQDGGTANTTDTGGGGAGGNSGTGGSGGADGGATACPFVASPKPISLGTILGIGKSPSSGTIYLVDQIDSLQRVFISDSSGTLARQRVSGSGSSPDFLVFTTNGPDAIVTVQIDTPTDQPKRMGVFQGILKDTKTMVIGQDGEELTVLAASEIASMPLRNLPGAVTTEYVASTDDGNFILVTRPTDDGSYEDFRLFYGPASAMDERVVSNTTRAQDGGSTRITFTLNGATATAYFPVIFADGGFAPGPATLTIGSQSTPLTRLSVPPANASYTCLAR
jgi:hypothetical protein